MSQIVQRRMESMIEELEEMKRIKLYTAEGIRTILKKRKQFEYNINGVTKNLEDYMEYIKYEKVLLKDIKVRRNKFRVADKKKSIEFKILSRIRNLYESAVQRFPDDFELHLAYFKFSREYNYKQVASFVLQKMMKSFSHYPNVWQIAASWYMSVDVNQALTVIHKGLSLHKDCKLLYSEAIQLELLTRSKGGWSDDSESDKEKDKICCEKLETYLHAVFKNINDFQFLLKILKVFEEHKFTQAVQNVIINRLINFFGDEPLVWHTLAQREKNGFHFGVAEDEVTNSTKFCLNRCFLKYQEGLSKIPNNKKTGLWNLYLDCLMELQKESDVANIIKKSTLLAALEEASKDIKLDEKYFVVWTRLTDNESDVIRILEKGIAVIPDSIALWKLKLKCAIIRDQTTLVNQTFKQAILHLKEKSLPVWLMTLRFHILTSTSDIIEMVYKDAVEQPKEVSDVLKPDYIQWICMCKGIKEAREVYKFLAQKEPYCKELHKIMAKIEAAEVNVNIIEAEYVHKLACEQFGKEDVDVWINYIEFYLLNDMVIEHKNQGFSARNKVLEIYKQAETALKQQELLLTDLKEKFDIVWENCKQTL